MKNKANYIQAINSINLLHTPRGKWKQNPEKWSHYYFKCILLTGNPFTLSQKCDSRSYFKYLGIIILCMKRNINAKKLIQYLKKKNSKSKPASPLELYVHGIIEVTLKLKFTPR